MPAGAAPPPRWPAGQPRRHQRLELTGGITAVPVDRVAVVAGLAEVAPRGRTRRYSRRCQRCCHRRSPRSRRGIAGSLVEVPVVSSPVAVVPDVVSLLAVEVSRLVVPDVVAVPLVVIPSESIPAAEEVVSSSVVVGRGELEVPGSVVRSVVESSPVLGFESPPQASTSTSASVVVRCLTSTMVSVRCAARDGPDRSPKTVREDCSDVHLIYEPHQPALYLSEETDRARLLSRTAGG